MKSAVALILLLAITVPAQSKKEDVCAKYKTDLEVQEIALQAMKARADSGLALINSLQHELDEHKGKVVGLSKQLVTVQDRSAGLEQQIASLEAQLAEQKQSLADKDAEIQQKGDLILIERNQINVLIVERDTALRGKKNANRRFWIAVFAVVGAAIVAGRR